MKTRRPVIDLRLGVWRDRLYFLLAWCGVYVEPWTPKDAASAWLSEVGGYVTTAIDDAGLDQFCFDCTEEWIREAVHHQVAHDRAVELLNHVGRP